MYIILLYFIFPCSGHTYFDSGFKTNSKNRQKIDACANGKNWQTRDKYKSTFE